MPATTGSDVRSMPAEGAGWSWFLAIMGIGSIANGVWMLLDPGHWYEHLPAAVPDTGPLNAHFVRDIGCAFLAMGLALCAAWRRPDWRAPLVLVAATFFVLHAALHVHDTALGLLGHHHWWLDAPGVYLPAVALVWAAVLVVRRPG